MTSLQNTTGRSLKFCYQPRESVIYTKTCTYSRSHRIPQHGTLIEVWFDFDGVRFHLAIAPILPTRTRLLANPSGVHLQGVLHLILVAGTIPVVRHCFLLYTVQVLRPKQPCPNRTLRQLKLLKPLPSHFDRSDRTDPILRWSVVVWSSCCCHRSNTNCRDQRSRASTHVA